MSIVVAVRKARILAVAADSRLMDGTLIASECKFPGKLRVFGQSVLGVVGEDAVEIVLWDWLEQNPQIVDLSSRSAIFRMLLKLHVDLRDKYFIETKEEEDQPVESSQLHALIANSSGIYEIGSYREVCKFERFWAIGSGYAFALGAIHVLYERDLSAAEIAKSAVSAAIQFDARCGSPIQIEILECGIC